MGDRPYDPIELDDQILKLLGVEDSHPRTNETILHPQLASNWNSIISKGLSETQKDEIINKYPLSGNCNLAAPILNPEIRSAFPETTTKRDTFFVKTQNLAGSALAALGTAITILLNDKDGGVDKLDLLEKLTDAGKLITELHHEKSIARRTCIAPNIQPQMKNIINETKIDEFLYGKNLAEKIKETKTAEKIGEEVKQTLMVRRKPVGPAARPTLNWRSPPVRGRFQQGGFNSNPGYIAEYIPKNRTQEKKTSRPLFQDRRPHQRSNHRSNFHSK